MANPTADWERLGDKFYRKVQLYTEVFDQDLELENYVVTGCSYGGAIGMSLLAFPNLSIPLDQQNCRASFLSGFPKLSSYLDYKICFTASSRLFSIVFCHILNKYFRKTGDLPRLEST
jgi:hypothetical protein